MNKAVQILMLIAMLPFAGNAREETLEERKQRISRKYMRETTKLAQSEIYVPTDEQEDDQVTGSEQFKEVPPQFDRQEGVARPVPSPRRPVPMQQNDNWLLADPSMDADSFADELDPYGTSSQTGPENDYWELFGGRPEAAGRREPVRKTPSYDPYEARNRAVESSTRQDIFGSSSTSRSGRTSLFGRREDESAQAGNRSSGTLGNGARTLYGSSPDSGLLDIPYSQRNRSSTTDRLRESQQPVPSYKSPYSRYDRNQDQQGTQTPQLEYTKPDAYKQWKERNKSWDPTSDDAYLDDLMRKNRR